MVHRIYVGIGAAIRRRRELIGMTQARLARGVGLSRPAVTNIERGGQALFVHQLVAFANTLGVKPTALLPASDQTARENVAGVMNNEVKALLQRLQNSDRRSNTP